MTHPSNPREWDASAYHRLSAPQLSWGQKVLARVRLRGDETLLDAGCGTGRLTEDLLQALPNGKVVAVDLSQNMLLTAREHLKPRFDSRVQFVAADLQDLPFGRAFDGIFSTAAFHWVPDHDRLFRSLLSVLRPGGWLQAQCGGGPNLARLLARVNALMASSDHAPYFSGFANPWVYNDAPTAAAILKRAGFIEVETSVESALTVLENAENYSQFVSSVILRVHLERIPDALRQKVVATLTEQASKDDPPFSLDYWRLNLSGRTA